MNKFTKKIPEKKYFLEVQESNNNTRGGTVLLATCRIECSSCGKWRIISYAKMTDAKDTDWVCTLLR